MISIEPMRWWHVAEVEQLERQLFPHDSWTVEQFWQELAQETRVYRVAVIDGGVVGYAGAFVLAPDSDVQTIAVAEAAQGEGLGGRLLGNLVDEARGAGCTYMMLEVRADNAAAIALYERWGFATISTRPRYYPDGADARIMRADVRAPRTKEPS